MKKYFFIGNRQSGKTSMAIYEFLKNPSETIFLCNNSESKKNIVKKSKIHHTLYSNITIYPPLGLRGQKFKRLICDDYLKADYMTRRHLSETSIQSGIEEVLCFSTPQKLYENKLFEIVKKMKRDERKLSPSDYENVCLNELIVEITDDRTFTSKKMEFEILDLYHNFITDSETTIIYNDNFFNSKIMNLESVDFFHESERELTEFKGQFIRNQTN